MQVLNNSRAPVSSKKYVPYHVSWRWESKSGIVIHDINSGRAQLLKSEAEPHTGDDRKEKNTCTKPPSHLTPT